MARLAVVLLVALCLSCASRSTKPDPVRILDVGQCWIEAEECRLAQVYDGRIVEICAPSWMARCREDELERYKREGCQLLRMPDRKVSVSCGVSRTNAELSPPRERVKTPPRRPWCLFFSDDTFLKGTVIDEREDGAQLFKFDDPSHGDHGYRWVTEDDSAKIKSCPGGVTASPYDATQREPPPLSRPH